MFARLGVPNFTSFNRLSKQAAPHRFWKSSHQTERTLQAGWGVESFNQQIFTGTELVNEQRVTYAGTISNFAQGGLLEAKFVQAFLGGVQNFFMSRRRAWPSATS